MSDKSKELAKLKRKLDRIIRNARQFIIDVESWNNNRLDAPPFDCEGQKILLTMALEGRRLLHAGDTIGYGKITARMVEIATQDVKDNA